MKKIIAEYRPKDGDTKLEQQPCDDAISRQAVLDINERHHGQMPNHVNHEIWKEIKALPSVTPQPKMGKWVKTPKAVMGEGYMWYCDKCEYQVYQDSSRPYPSEKFCPNCGQPKMQEVEDK